jgi:Ca-activated chloride channel family protein
MRRFFFILGIIFTFQASAQTGGLYVRCLDRSTVEPVSVCIELIADSSIIDSGQTDEQGRVHFSDVPAGMVEVQLEVENIIVAKQRAFVQSDQVFQLVLEVDLSSFTNIPRNPTAYEVGEGGEEIIPKNHETVERLPVKTFVSSQVDGNTNKSFSAGIQEIQAVQCVAYQAPLIDKSHGTIGMQLTREDISRMPTRSVHGIAGTAGGVNLNEVGQDMYIRGARSDANAFYIDGIRVTDFYGIPKTSINSVQVITGGVPACYGDLTGGVIAVETNAFGDIQSQRSYQQIQQSYGRSRRSYGYQNDHKPESQLNLDRFASIYENDFLSTVAHPNSTFGIDVDRASWSYVQRRFDQRGTISRDAVKLEEMINAFHYKKVEVPKDELLHVELSRTQCAWNVESELVTIHLKAKDLPEDVARKPHNFVFLVDVSGSMSSNDKIHLVKKGLNSFVQTLKSTDKVAIVTYAGNVGIVLEPTSCDNKSKILNAIRNLNSGGSTNGMGGIQAAYSLAEENYDPELNNRILLCTDGDFNVGISNTGDLEKYIAQKRGKGIYLTALGFGMGNYRNDILETLADRGDGNHFYINNTAEMNRVLVEEVGNLMNIARDVKLNVEFNPKLVTEYRLIGYENRMLKPKDFEDDTKDAGEIGYSHQVTAVYEIKRGNADKEQSHFTKTKIASGKNELAYVKLRYKSFEDSASVERNYSLTADEEFEKNELVNLVASFGLLLRDSMFKGDMTEEKLKKMARKFTAKSDDEKDLKAMISKL